MFEDEQIFMITMFVAITIVCSAIAFVTGYKYCWRVYTLGKAVENFQGTINDTFEQLKPLGKEDPFRYVIELGEKYDQLVQTIHVRFPKSAQKDLFSYSHLAFDQAIGQARLLRKNE